MDAHYVVLSSRQKLDKSSTNNAEFTVASRALHEAHAIKAITPIMVTFLDSFTSTPSIVYVGISLFANGHMTTAENGHSYNILCTVPMTNIDTGKSVVWEPRDKKMHRIVNHSADYANQPIKITLLDENFNKLVTNPSNNVDIIVELHNDEDLHS